jgi:hypothetical protein
MQKYLDVYTWAQDILWAPEEHTKLKFAAFWSQYLYKKSYLEAHLKVAGKFGIEELNIKIRSAYRIKLKSRKYGAQLALRGCVVK